VPWEGHTCVGRSQAHDQFPIPQQEHRSAYQDRACSHLCGTGPASTRRKVRSGVKQRKLLSSTTTYNKGPPHLI